MSINKSKKSDSQIVDEFLESCKPTPPRQYGLRLFNIVYCIFWACIVWAGMLRFGLWIFKGFK